MIIGQYTDQDVIIDITGGSLDNISGIHITFAQGVNSIDITNVSVESSTRLMASLTQAHTGKFRADMPVQMQMNYFNAFGKRKRSNIVEIAVGTNLLRRIVEYG